MSILPVGAVSAVSYLSPTSATSAATGASGDGFASVLGSSIDGLQQAQSTSNDLAVKAVTGDLDDVHDYTIAATQSATMLELTAAVRNKAVEAFTEIMRMTA